MAQECVHHWRLGMPRFEDDGKGNSTRVTAKVCALCGLEGEDRESQKGSFNIHYGPVSSGLRTDTEGSAMRSELKARAYAAAEEIAAHLLAGLDKRSLTKGDTRRILSHETEVSAMLRLVGRNTAADLLGVSAGTLSNRYGQRSDGHHKRRVHDVDTMRQALDEMPGLRKSWLRPVSVVSREPVERSNESIEGEQPLPAEDAMSADRQAEPDITPQPDREAGLPAGAGAGDESPESYEPAPEVVFPPKYVQQPDGQGGQGGQGDRQPCSELVEPAGPLPLTVTADDLLALSEEGRRQFWELYGELWYNRQKEKAGHGQ